MLRPVSHHIIPPLPPHRGQVHVSRRITYRTPTWLQLLFSHGMPSCLCGKAFYTSLLLVLLSRFLGLVASTTWLTCVPGSKTLHYFQVATSSMRNLNTFWRLLGGQSQFQASATPVSAARAEAEASPSLERSNSLCLLFQQFTIVCSSSEATSDR